MGNLTKEIVVPVDGSKNSLRSIEYLHLIYGPEYNLNVSLFHVLPSLPRVLTEDEAKDRELRDIRTRLKYIEGKNIHMAEEILTDAKTALLVKGLKEENVKTFYQKMEFTIPRDIYLWSRVKQADAVVVGRRGRSDLQTFFMGEVADKLVECCEECPLWIVGGDILSKKVLLCVDASENALKAVKHTGRMLSGTDCRITLFHTMRHLSRFVPQQVLEGEEELIHLWKKKAGRLIGTYMETARKVLLNAGLKDGQINTKIMEGGTRSAANDILREALDNDYGTVVLGRRGLSMLKEFMLGSVTKKVLFSLTDLAIWVVH